MPLPIYQQAGLLSQPSPKLDFADLRESERTSQIMQQSLDRLSEFAFKAAARKAAIQGRQWAVDNPVTPEAISDAMKEGQDLSTFIPAAGTIIGDEARKMTAYQLRASLETSARAQMAGITERVELGQITSLKEVQDEMYGIIKGGGKVIGAIDPEVSTSFQASVAVAGNAVFQYAAKKIHELNIEGLKYQATKLIEDSSKNISTTIKSTLDPVALKDKIALEERRVSDILYTTRDPAFHEKGMTEFRKNVAEAKVAVLSDYLSSTEFNKSESETLALMRQNNVGKYSAIWAGLDEPSKLSIRTKVQQQFVETSMARNREKEVQKDENNKTFVSTYADWLREKNPKAKKALEAKLIPLAPTTAELDKILKPDTTNGTGNVLLFSNLREEVFSGRITSPFQLHKYVRNGGLNADQLNSLQTQMYSSENKTRGEIDKKFNRASGIGDVISGVYDKNAAQFIKKQNIEKIFDSLEKKARADQDALPPEKRTGINLEQLSNDALTTYENTIKNDVTKTAARAKLERIAENKSKEFNKILSITETTSIDDLKRITGKKKGAFFESKVFSDDELDTIQKQQKILSQ
jgi:hypothetical protein